MDVVKTWIEKDYAESSVQSQVLRGFAAVLHQGNSFSLDLRFVGTVVFSIRRSA